MQKHLMRLNSETFKLISSGKKIVELRLYDKKRRSINVGDIIEFVDLVDLRSLILTRVCAIFNYSTFMDLVKDLPIEWFGCETREEVLNKVSLIYLPEQEIKHSVVGIKFEVQNS